MLVLAPGLLCAVLLVGPGKVETENRSAPAKVRLSEAAGPVPLMIELLQSEDFACRSYACKCALAL